MRISDFITQNQRGYYVFTINNKKYGYFKFVNKDLNLVTQVRDHFLLKGKLSTMRKFKLVRNINKPIKQLAVNVTLDKILYSNNTSGFDGIYFDNRRNKWRVRIQLNHVRISIGEYKSLDIAIKMRDFARECDLEYIRTNRSKFIVK